MTEQNEARSGGGAQDQHLRLVASGGSGQRSAQAETMTQPALKNPSGGGTFDGMEPASKEYVDLRIDAAIGRVEGKLDTIIVRLDGKPGYGAMLGTAFTVAISVIGVILAALAFAGDRFDGGIGLADQRQEQLRRDSEQDAIIKRLDALLAAQPKPESQAPENPTE